MVEPAANVLSTPAVAAAILHGKRGLIGSVRMTVEANTAAASAEQRETFDRDGYVILDRVAADDMLDAIVAAMQPLFGQEPHEEDGVRYYRNRIQHAWRINKHVKALAHAPTVIPLLEALYGRQPLAWQTLNFHRGTQQAPHSDAIHFNTIPEGYMCGVWVALEDMDMDNGPLVYYPGSHKLPYVTPADFGVEAKWENYHTYEDYVQGVIARERLEPAYATIKKGQAIVWAANLLHGGAHQNDRERTRLSQVTHYFFEGCRYYTPMASEGDQIRWRDPVWIT
jgi:ectoine hydroxylase-related dioxygenase (phytanoyl-CoA dioxygenase family)